MSKSSRPDQMIYSLQRFPKQVRNIFTHALLTIKMCVLRWGGEYCLFWLSLGTTWVSYILDLLYFGETRPERQTTIPIYERVPFMDLLIPGVFSGWWSNFRLYQCSLEWI